MASTMSMPSTEGADGPYWPLPWLIACWLILPPTVATPELRLDCPDAVKFAVVDHVKAAMAKYPGWEKAPGVDPANPYERVEVVQI